MPEDQGQQVDWAARLKAGTSEQNVPASARPEGVSQPNSTERNIGGVASTEDRGTNAEDNKDANKQTQPNQSLTNPNLSDMKLEKQDDGTMKSVTERDGRTVTVSSVSEDEAKKLAEASAKTPAFQDLTQSLTGVPGQSNLTDGGRLATDQSLRDGRTVDEINEELNEKSGPNPTPNRIGNEVTRAANELTAGGPAIFSQIDRDTNEMADRLSEIRRKGSLTDQDIQDLQEMERKLRNTGRLQRRA